MSLGVLTNHVQGDLVQFLLQPDTVAGMSCRCTQLVSGHGPRVAYFCRSMCVTQAGCWFPFLADVRFLLIDRFDVC